MVGHRRQRRVLGLLGKDHPVQIVDTVEATDHRLAVQIVVAQVADFTGESPGHPWVVDCRRQRPGREQRGVVGNLTHRRCIHQMVVSIDGDHFVAAFELRVDQARQDVGLQVTDHDSLGLAIVAQDRLRKHPVDAAITLGGRCAYGLPRRRCSEPSLAGRADGDARFARGHHLSGQIGHLDDLVVVAAPVDLADQLDGRRIAFASRCPAGDNDEALTPLRHPILQPQSDGASRALRLSFGCIGQTCRRLGHQQRGDAGHHRNR